MSKVQPNRRTLFRLALFLACAVLILLGLNTLYAFTNTLKRLDEVESERDQWQRPLDVMRALDLREGQTIVDLGSESCPCFSCGQGRYWGVSTIFRSWSEKKTIRICL